MRDFTLIYTSKCNFGNSFEFCFTITSYSITSRSLNKIHRNNSCLGKPLGTSFCNFNRLQYPYSSWGPPIVYYDQIHTNPYVSSMLGVDSSSDTNRNGTPIPAGQCRNEQWKTRPDIFPSRWSAIRLNSRKNVACAYIKKE